MVQLPRLSNTRVSQSPIPSAYAAQNVPDYNAAHGPIREAGEIAQDASQEIFEQDKQERLRKKYEEEQRENARQVASAEFVAQATAKEIELKAALHGVKGKEALKASQDAMTQYDKWFAETTKGISDPDLQGRVKRQYDTHRNSLYSDALPYGESQYRAYDDEVNKSLKENEIKAGIGGWTDPERINLAIARIAASNEALAARNGRPSEWADKETAEAVGELRSGAISRMIGAGQIDRARKFFEATPEGFANPEAVRKALEKDESLLVVQRGVDEILGRRLKLGDSLDEANKRFEGKDRETARDMLKERFKDEEENEKLRQEAVYERIVKAYDANPTVDPRKLDPVGFETLDSKRRDALTARYAKQDRIPTTADRQLLLKIIHMDPKSLGTMTPVDFDTEYWSKLPAEYRDEARSKYKQAVDAVRNPAKRDAFKGIMSDEEMIFNAAKQAGFGGMTAEDTMSSIHDKERTGIYTKGASSKAQALLDFRETVNTSFQTFHAVKGRNPDDDEKLKLIDHLVIKKYIDDKPTFSFPKKDEFVKGLETPFDSIPVEERDSITTKLKMLGKDASREKVERLYKAMLLNDASALRGILNE